MSWRERFGLHSAPLPRGATGESFFEGDQRYQRLARRWTAAPDHCTVHGADYPVGAEAFGNIFWKHGWALGTRAGLLVSLVSRPGRSPRGRPDPPRLDLDMSDDIEGKMKHEPKRQAGHAGT